MLKKKLAQITKKKTVADLEAECVHSAIAFTCVRVCAKLCKYNNSRIPIVLSFCFSQL